MKLVFMGTPDYAAGILEELILSPYEVAAVFTQPDRPQGRKGTVVPPTVKELALSAGIPVYQPVRIRRERWVKLLEEIRPDAMVVAAFGQILPASILNIAPCLNVHASLLPKYRGSSPIQQAIADGEAETGVTIMRMDEGIDTGNILLAEALPIGPDDTGETVFDKLVPLGRRLIRRTLDAFAEGDPLTGTPQDGSIATYAPMLSREDAKMNPAKSAHKLDCEVRAHTPWPGATLQWGEKVLKIGKVRPLPEAAEKAAEIWPEGLHPGHILNREELAGLGIAPTHVVMAAGGGLLEILKLQLPGKKMLDADAFLRGCPLLGETLE